MCGMAPEYDAADVERAMRQTLGAVDIASERDIVDVSRDGHKFPFTYRFADYSESGVVGASTEGDTIMTGVYDPTRGEDGILDDIFVQVAEAERGNGYGRQIVEQGLEELAREIAPWRGHARKGSRAFWEALGYELVPHGDAVGLRKTADDGTPIAVLGEPYEMEDTDFDRHYGGPDGPVDEEVDSRAALEEEFGVAPAEENLRAVLEEL